MPDRKFFKRASSFSVKDLAAIAEARIGAGTDPEYILEDVASLDMATERDLSFLDNVKYKDQFRNTGAGACFVHTEWASLAPEGVNLLISEHPYKAYAKAAQHFYPQEFPRASISEKAAIHSTAKIGANCIIEDFVVIGEGVEIGSGCWLEPGCVIRPNVFIGKECHIGAGVTVSHAVIGDHVRLYPGVRIGQDGFGFAIDPAGHVKVPQLGRVIIENSVEIGANTTIDRGAGPDTVIGQGTWIDNLVQIGHNVRIGRGCIIVAQVGIAGSAEIDDFAAIGGQVGIAGHLHIGKGARVGAQSGVMRDIPDGEEHLGTPAMPIKQSMRQVAALNRLIKTKKSS